MGALDRFLPDFHFGERHSITVRAPAGAVYRAVWEVTLAEMPLAGVLFWLRALPARLLRRRYRFIAQPASGPDPGRTPILRAVLSRSFVLLYESPDREVAIGTIGRFWQATGGSVPLPDAAAFQSFRDPTYARAVMDFRLTPLPNGRSTHLTTETRIQVPGPAARRRFRAYWLVVYPGSALIRRLWLRAIQRRAERSAATA